MAISNGTEAQDVGDEKALDGQSFLKQTILSGGANFTLAGTDHGLHANMDLSVFQPTVPEGHFFLGQVAVQGYPDTCPSSCIIVQPMNDDPANPCLKSPTGFSRIWCDAGSGKDSDYSFWQPNCTDPNYIAIGTIIFTGPGTNGQTPDPKNYPALALVRSDLVKYATPVSTLIWDDAGSGATANASLFPLPNSNYFICSTGPEGQPPTGQYPDLLPPSEKKSQ
ncbi:MAG: Vps62-related protein [Paraburkholderia sp.]|jgi:hypothetical protein|uniref:Vps62-related protein n=1 Tax=Burkholderiaceae TaxID=119060 RepID=UPI0010F512DD|nr:Vps62-related protein [Burkholderia sp. 4M9327F10]